MTSRRRSSPPVTKLTMAIHILRYDDFSAHSSSRVEEGLFDVFLRHRVPCTIAAIPYACSPADLLTKGEVNLCALPGSKVRLLGPLLKEGLAEVALHGYCHLALAPVRGYQESPGM